MKPLTAFMLAAISLPFGVKAFAQTAIPALTRAEVRAQLIQAEADGYLPTRKSAYPPSAVTIEHNREIYAIQHDTRAGADSPTPDAPAARGGSAVN